MSLERIAYKALESVVGSNNISEDPAVLKGYQYIGMSFMKDISNRTSFFEPFGGPVSEAVVMPASTEEVQGIVKVCNRYKIKYKAHSTGFGAQSLPGLDHVVVVDLRRMDRLVEIDEKNMFAVIEPYVTAHRLQSEAMKKGLNCHIITAGPQHSPFASATSFQGQGPASMTTGVNQRNLLGVEWVTPTGEVMRMGSPGNGAGWFCGDGPGPDFRGIVRGCTGACGGLGIFTRIGFKLYPWPGPAKLEKTGKLPLVGIKTPENFKYYYAYWEDWDDVSEAAYQIHEARVAYTLCRIPPDWLGWYLTQTNAEFYERFKNNTLPIQRQHGKYWNAVIAARTKRDFEYKKKVFEKIVADTKGAFLEFTPEEESLLLFAQLNPLYALRLFRAKKASLGLGGPNFAQMESMSLLKTIQETDEKCLADYVKPGGALMDTGPENSWAWSVENNKLWTESIHFLEETDESLKQAVEYSMKTQTAIQQAKGALQFDVRMLCGATNDFLGPQLCNVHDWMRKIKKALDPENLADHSAYISPEPPQPPGIS